MTLPKYLVFTDTGHDPSRRVAGLSLALRLALEAQRSGFSGIVAPETGPVPPVLLRDQRLKLPLVAVLPAGAAGVAVPCTTVMHRSDFQSAVAAELPADVHSPLSAATNPEDPYYFAPVEVIDDTTRRLAERVLFRSLRKSADGWTSRYLNRYVSLFISRQLTHLPLTPNLLSLVILGIGLAGAFAASIGSYWSLLVGATLFQLQSVLDGCDGELSRITFRASRLGEWLDTVGDDLTNYSFFLGAGVGLSQTTHNDLFLVAGLVTALAGGLGSAFEYAYLIRIGSGDLLKYPLSQATTARSGPMGLIAPLFKRDSFVMLTWLCALFGVVHLALLVFAVAAVGLLGAVLRTEYRMWLTGTRPPRSSARP